MRKAFITSLCALAENDPRVVLLTGDLGFSVLEPFAEKFPNRFFNVGVAEQNMLGIAAGLAADGYIPFCYSIAPFATLRGYEFFRNGAIHHNFPVRLVGVGGGFDYGSAGPSHHALEDIAVMRVHPALTVLAPCDSAQVRAALSFSMNIAGPIYLRLGKDELDDVSLLGGQFTYRIPDHRQLGTEVAIATYGSLARECIAAADLLQSKGVSPSLIFFSTLNPVDDSAIADILGRYQFVVSAENHYITGGLGSLLAETIATKGLRTRLFRCGVQAGPDGLSGSNRYYLAKHGLSVEAIALQTLNFLSE